MLAASKALAAGDGDDELNRAYIIPSVFNAEVHHAVAAAVRRRRGWTSARGPIRRSTRSRWTTTARRAGSPVLRGTWSSRRT